MRIKRHVTFLLGILLIILVLKSTGCGQSVVTELLNKKSELAVPVLVFSIPLDKDRIFHETFQIQHPGKYTVEFNTKLKIAGVKRYELPDTESRIVGEISIYKDDGELIKQKLNTDISPKVIGRGLFGFESPKVIPLGEELRLEVKLSEIDHVFSELYNSITFIIKRQGVLYD